MYVPCQLQSSSAFIRHPGGLWRKVGTVEQAAFGNNDQSGVHTMVMTAAA